jgi:predicted phosphohydrolase
MNTIQDLGSPNAEAQALIADLGRKEALIWARNSEEHYTDVHLATVDPERAAWARGQKDFWSDVATLIKLETQSDETAEEAAKREGK